MIEPTKPLFKRCFVKAAVHATRTDRSVTARRGEVRSMENTILGIVLFGAVLGILAAALLRGEP